jgi:cell division protease FtsH
MADVETPSEPRERDGARPNSGPRFGYMAGWIFLAAFWVWVLYSGLGTHQVLPYSEFKDEVAAGRVISCEVGPNEIRGQLRPREVPDGVADPSAQESGEPSAVAFRTIRIEDPDLLAELREAGVEVRGKLPSAWPQFVGWLLPLALIALFWVYVFRRAAGGGGLAQTAMSFGKSRARLVAEREVDVSFRDVAGCDEAKAELAEVVEFLKRPEHFARVGAKIPKGVLLVGPPGTGKTLLARAVAGEAGVPFYSLSGSDFVEMFVGVGAARVRDLFQQAAQHAPCIVFIDELDAIGRARGVRVGNVNDEREHTLNQLLVEMDGFDPNSGVILLSATNRPDVLDAALLRPGRFDRQVVLDAPDVEGRRAILEVHAKGKPLEPDVDLTTVARATPGFCGADLANTMNEAALAAARHESGRITQADLEAAVEKVVAGPERKSRRLDPLEKRRVAYHEAGHAVVAAYCEEADPVRKISIVPRGRAALGYTLQLPTGDQHLFTRSALLDRIRGLLGGRAAEELALGEVSTGAENDLALATNLTRSVVGRFGMGESARLLHCAPTPQSGWPQEGEGFTGRDCSEQTAARVDEESEQILDQLYEEAKQLLGEHKDALERVAAALLERESLDELEFRRLLEGSDPAAIDAPTARPGAEGTFER